MGLVNTPAISAYRRILFAGLTIGLCAGALELLSVAALSLQTGELVGWGGLESSQRAVIVAGGSGFDDQQTAIQNRRKKQGHVMHPYVGFVHNGDGPELLLDALSGKQRTVAIMGGSVAAAQGRETEELRDELLKSPAFAGQDLAFVELAIAGVKQPQQLVTLAYLISLGAKFDIVVNLDGFNELMVSSDLAKIGVYPHYSHAWPFKAHELYSQDQLVRIGQMGALRGRRVSAASWAVSFPFRLSATAAFLWSSYDRALQRELAESEVELANSVRNPRGLEGEDFNYQARGPWDDRYEDEELVFTEVAELWRKSSVTMKQLADANGFEYFHFLQPNQYVDSKPMSSEERERAFSNEGAFRERARLGYPILQREAERLEAAGVHYYDLTGVFAGNAEVIYRDGCCHVNERGRQIIGRAMGRRIAAALAGGGRGGQR